MGTNGELDYLIDDARKPGNGITNDETGPGKYCEQPKPVDQLPWQLRYGVIEAVIMLFYLAKITSLPIIEQYLYARFLGKYEANNNNNANSCALSTFTNTSNTSVIIENIAAEDSVESIAQQRTARWILILNLCTFIPALFTTIIMGSYSDLRGRKLVIALPLFGAIIRVSVILIVMEFELPILFLLPGYFVDGICGSFGVFNLAAFAILADITKNEKDRSLRLTIVEAITGLVIAASLVSSGYFIKAVGFFLPLVVVIVIFLVNFIAVIFLLPETVIQVPGAKILTLQNVKRTVNVYRKTEPRFRRKTLLYCLAVIVLGEPALHGKSSVETLYVLRSPLCWDSVKIGIYNGIGSSLQMGVMLAAIKPLQKYFSPLTIIIIGVSSGLASLLLESVAMVDFVMFLAMPRPSLAKLHPHLTRVGIPELPDYQFPRNYIVPVAGGLVMITLPLLRSHMSVSVDKDEQGAMFSGISLVQLMSSGVMDSLLNGVYVATVASFPGFVFVFGAIMSVLALAILVYLRHHTDRKDFIVDVDKPATPAEIDH